MIDSGAPYRIQGTIGPQVVCQTLEGMAAQLLAGGLDRDETYILCSRFAWHFRGHDGAFDWLIMEGIDAAQALIYLIDGALRGPLTKEIR